MGSLSVSGSSVSSRRHGQIIPIPKGVTKRTGGLFIMQPALVQVRHHPGKVNATDRSHFLSGLPRF